MQPVYMKGLSYSSGKEIQSVVRDLTLQATNDLSWLSEGDTVLLKPALNSPYPYPATTHPLAVLAVADLLTERGADIVIGDQSGIEHVLHHPGGVLRGSTARNFLRSGMNDRQDRRFIGFEEEGWDEGFFHYQSECTRSWKNGYYITQWVKKADHIINLPRVSSHSITGATLGLKNMVGLLREDSRMEFHANGPMNSFIIRSAKGSTLSTVDDKTDTFFEKIVEISDAVSSKLRFTLFCATEIQATFGPDPYSMKIGLVKLGKSSVVRSDPGLVFGSTDPIAAEAAALAILKDAKQRVPIIQRYLEQMVLSGNPYIRNFDGTGIRTHPFIRHGITIGLGRMPEEIIADNLAGNAAERISQLLNQD